jgi:nucleoredoxin
VFISGDRDLDTFKEYFEEMPWLALPYESINFQEIKDKLNGMFEVRGIPALVALGADGLRINKDVDLRQLVGQHKGDAFPMTPSHVQDLGKKQEEARAGILSNLSKGSLLAAIRRPGGGDATGLADALASHDYVALLFSDGDGDDDTYKAVAKIHSDVNKDGAGKRLGLLYVGYTKYNDACDHDALYAKQGTEFYGLLAPSDEEKEKLAKLTRNGVQAPHFLLLGRDGEGLLSVTSDDPGCQSIRQYGAKGYPWSAARVEELKAIEKARVIAAKEKQVNLQFLKGSDGRDGLFTKDAVEVKVDKLAGEGADAVVGLYFSAHWCGPCRGFTPELAKCHQKLKDAGKKFEVVFISSDNSEAEFKDYMAEMPWLALPYSERELKADLSGVFEVRGIPTLVLLQADGTLITGDGREAVSLGAEYFPWGSAEMEKARAEAQVKAEERKKAAIDAECSSHDLQRANGGPVLKRLRGTPGEALDHDATARTIKFFEFATIGTPDSLAKSGTVYYELEILESEGIPQVGFASPDFEIGVDTQTGEGVGDDKLSWGFDGVRQLAWFDGDKSWPCEWQVGDVLGFAAHIDVGKIAVSKNGVWSETPLGVFFSHEIIKSGVYPCLTGGHGYKLRYNLNGTTHGNYKYDLPTSQLWDSPAGGYTAQ